jgi:hypothetical protein
MVEVASYLHRIAFYSFAYTSEVFKNSVLYVFLYLFYPVFCTKYDVGVN